MANNHDGHRERVKKEFRQRGLEHFPDHKVLEMLLFYSFRRGDTNELGHALLSRFGSISGVFDASYELLEETPGMGGQSALLIKFVSALIRRYMDDYASKITVIADPEAAKEFMRFKFLGEQRECVYIACLGSNGKVLFCDRLAEGAPEKVEISPVQVVRTALRADAAQVVLAHNHPNGICIPSRKDLNANGILFDELRRVEVLLFDHIVVAPDGVCSMLESNMFPQGRYMNF